MRLTRIHHRMAMLGLAMALAGACSAPPPPAPSRTADAADSTGDAVVQMGDAWARASVVQASALPASVARQYGVERDPRTLLLLVVAGKGPPASATPVPVQVSAQVTGLTGSTQAIAMRQVRDGASVDSIGIVRTTLPDTLAFDLQLSIAGQPPARLRFSREFYPQ